MTTVRSMFAKGTVQGALAGIIIVTAAALAWTDRIDGPSFLALAIVVAGYYFKNQQASDKS